VGESIMIDLLDKNRNAPAAIRLTCESAKAGRVRFSITPMARLAGSRPATMGIQSATSELHRLQKEKDILNNRLKGIDAQIRAVSPHNRTLANIIGKSRGPIQTRIRAIDSRRGQLNRVTAALRPLHQKAALQLRATMTVDGQEVVLAGP
jgi:hypothetical protein